MPAGSVSRSWRRYLRFSVRGSIVLVLVIGVWLAWLVRVIRNAQVQRDAVVAVERNLGMVRYNGELIFWDSEPGWHEIKEEETWAPRWLVRLIGVDYFHHVTSAYVPRGAGTEAVGRLTSLETLDLGSIGINDADLANLTGLTKLSSLDLFHARITDAGLVHLTGLTNLSELDLRYTQVTDAGSVRLKDLTSLQRLDIDGTQITDAGIKKLKQALPNLTIDR
jgi:hypothetical protein